MYMNLICSDNNGHYCTYLKTINTMFVKIIFTKITFNTNMIFTFHLYLAGCTEINFFKKCLKILFNNITISTLSGTLERKSNTSLFDVAHGLMSFFVILLTPHMIIRIL